MTAGAINIIKNNGNIIFCMNPQITFFKSVYRKHTKFVRTEKIYSTHGGLVETADDASITINSDGDLLANISLNILTGIPITPRNGSNIENDIGTNIFEEVTLNIKRTHEQLSSKYINMHARLNNPKSINSTYQIDDTQKIICTNGNRYQNMSLCGGVINDEQVDDWEEPNCSYTNFDIIIPLPFSFSKDTGTAIPVFLFYENPNDITLDIHFGSRLQNSKLIAMSEIKHINLKAICTWYDISEYEQRRFKSSHQEYLVEKIKYHRCRRAATKISEFVSNKPIKGLYLVCNGTHGTDDKIFHYNDIKYLLKIGGVGLFNNFLPHTFFSKKNIYEYFIGCNYSDVTENRNAKIDGRIAFIPFCLKMSEGPSGCINSINALDLEINFEGNESDNIDIDLYIIYYTILKISDKYVKYVYTPE